MFATLLSPSSPRSAPDPWDRELISPYDHHAFLDACATWVEVWRGDECLDTGLRCPCGREVVADEDAPSGWSHVGIGQEGDLTGYHEWLEDE